MSSLTVVLGVSVLGVGLIGSDDSIMEKAGEVDNDAAALSFGISKFDKSYFTYKQLYFEKSCL